MKNTGSKLTRLVEYFRKIKRVAIAFSGGIDSTALAFAASKALNPADIKLVHLTTPVHPRKDIAAAEKIAEKLGLGITLVKLNPLKNPDFVKNTPQRCFFCKKAVFGLVRKHSRGFTIVEGTNASDMTGHRPGFKAVRLMNVKSPLYELGMSKDDARAIVKEAGFNFYAALPNTCFATRMSYGKPVTVERIKRVEKAESFIKQLIGVDFIRVRDYGADARIELKKDDIVKAAKKSTAIAKKLHKLGYRLVSVDMDGYRQGSLNI